MKYVVKIKDLAFTFFLWVEDAVIRWVNLFASIATAVLLFVVGFDFSKARVSYPDWKGLWDIVEHPRWLFVLAASALTSAMISILISARQPTIRKLKTTNSKLQDQVDQVGENIHNLFHGVLFNLAKKLEFSLDGAERISLYLHKNSKGCFVPCGRFSHNPEFIKKGRTRFDDDKGCIAKGWQNDWHFDNTVPASDEDAAEHSESKYGVPPEVTKNLRMQSKLFAVKRIVSPDDRPIAVLVVESTKSGNFTENELKEKLHDVSREFGKMIQAVKHHIPTPQNAEESGL